MPGTEIPATSGLSTNILSWDVSLDDISVNEARVAGKQAVWHPVFILDWCHVVNVRCLNGEAGVFEM